MGFFSWVEGKLHHMQWHDISCIEFSSFVFALLIAVLWPPILSLDWYWYGIISLLAAWRPLKVMLSTKGRIS